MVQLGDVSITLLDYRLKPLSTALVSFDHNLWRLDAIALLLGRDPLISRNFLHIPDSSKLMDTELALADESK